MDTSDDVLMLGDVLLGMWSARDRLLKAGLATDRGDPIGGLAQSLTAAALWPRESVASAYGRARAVRTGFDESGEFGPAVGGWNGTTSSLGIDLALPWASIAQRVPALSAFARQRRGERWAWNANAGTAPLAVAEGPLADRYSGLARLRVRARFAPHAPDEGSLEAASFKDVRGETAPLNDLHIFVLFARVDEEYNDLRDANFVWTAVIFTDECLNSMAREIGSDVLRWRQIHARWDCLPRGAHDATGLLRAVRIPGW
ncbi:hypothetical protein [Streptomyces lancefieldiae]|uniref:Uncharacterized protein n=1 Tax=Streptomyces lancefieldiae TaxID=3075520 RepID=A0ABU3B192_9ACTN|nr:hypothetical protein [Streptomyces sp. DSM 40712]MDT0616209.1 hypothetical protein [Streptomyces sp. DSM 40712]